jgi:hypothetical protein
MLMSRRELGRYVLARGTYYELMTLYMEILVRSIAENGEKVMA